ncbi:hypothetical protein C0Q70_07720 [Pomacea canaliculata]|uniref:SAM domain-containing protein n=1 Tax=Pomacea canaliculata TaxID=400727 RepID=A0A2T7PFT4_POMCA|nr:hypothetical protein C0Q70_07720 [Pomacea canaliculata]
MTLPVRLSFYQQEHLVFTVGRDHRTHEYFGDLTLVSVYLEPFIGCLLIQNDDGKVTNKIVALPCRLRILGVSLVEGLEGGSEGRDTLKELITSYVQATKGVSSRRDPFMKELALISKKIKIKKETDIPDYIDEDTFIDIVMKRPRQRQDEFPLNSPTTTREDEEPQYETLWPHDRDSHVYVLPLSDVDGKNRILTKENLEGDSQTVQTVAKSQEPVSLSSRDGVTAVLSKPSAEASRDATATSSKAPALPPVSHRVPLRSTSSSEDSQKPQTLMLSSASSRPNLFQVPDQAMPRSARPALRQLRRFDVERLSVDDVCRRLKELGLEKHCKKFKKSLIDGKLLKRISRKALEEEFRLSEIVIDRWYDVKKYFIDGKLVKRVGGKAPEEGKLQLSEAEIVKLGNTEEQSSKSQRFFTWTESKTFTSRDVFNGMLGDLPLLLVVSSGFSPAPSKPGINHLEQFETGQVVFAFQRAFHRRVLLHDSHDRTLSLPLLSSILFRVKDPVNKGEGKVTTLDDVVKTMTLPVRLSFYQQEHLVFTVGRDHRTHEYFGDLTLVSVYLEPFIGCLGCQGSTELALISKKIKIKKETDIPDYIDEDTFIDIVMKRPRQRQGDGPLNSPLKTKEDEDQDPQYETLWPHDRDSHVYVLPPSDVDDKNRILTKENLEGDSQTVQYVAKSQEPASNDGVTAVLSKPSAEVLPPVPHHPQVAPSSRDATPTSSKAPALPPVSHRVPLRSTSTGALRESTHTFMQSSAYSNPNLSQAMAKSDRPVRSHPSRFDIGQLSVDDVCRRLKELGLEKHCKKFKKSLIDGKLLKRISRKALEEEFRLSEVEIVKLSTFIDEGHIPK